MIIAPLWKRPQVQSKWIPTLRKQKIVLIAGEKKPSKFELAGHEWDFFLSEILTLKIIVVTRKNAQGPGWKCWALLRITQEELKIKILYIQKLPILLSTFSFSGICSSSEIICLLLNAIFLSASQTVKRLTNHLVNLLGFEISSRKYKYSPHAPASPCHQEWTGEAPACTGTTAGLC